MILNRCMSNRVFIDNTVWIKFIYVTGWIPRLLLYWKNTWLRTMCCLQIIWQRSWGAAILHREDVVQAGCDWLNPLLTSYCAWLVNSIAWLVASLQIGNSINADMLLDSGLNLFDIMANLCSKLYCEVLLKSRNYIVYLLKWTSDFDFNKRGCVRQIWVD